MSLHTIARLRIHEGKLAEFKNIGKQCRDIVAEKDSGTLKYDWYFNADETECVVRESYTNSDAMMEHMGNLGDVLGSLLALADIELEFHGDLSQQLKDAVAPFGPKIYSLGFGL